MADVQAFDTEQRSQCGVGRLVSRYVGEPAPTLRALVHYLRSHDQQHLAGIQWLAGKIASAP